jgi:hypothetical protein
MTTLRGLRLDQVEELDLEVTGEDFGFRGPAVADAVRADVAAGLGGQRFKVPVDVSRRQVTQILRTGCRKGLGRGKAV